MAKGAKRTLAIGRREELLRTLRDRFTQFPQRHTDVAWTDVQRALDQAGERTPDKLWSLQAMEDSGGEPDVVRFNPVDGSYLFMDCSTESPVARRSLCYDAEALAARRANKPAHSAQGLAMEMGVSLLTEDDYRYLQTIGAFDLKTSSWIQTPPAIRALGGALFCERRYDGVFMYHNGADSYFGARGFRSKLHV